MALVYNSDGTVTDDRSEFRPTFTFAYGANQQGPVLENGSFFTGFPGSSGQQQAAPNPTPPPQQPQQPRTFQSRDGLVTFDQYGRRLDSVGNVARPSFGGGSAAVAPGTAPGAGITSEDFLREDGTFDWQAYVNAQTPETRFFQATPGGNITLPFLQGTPYSLPASAAPAFDLNTSQFLFNSYANQRDFDETERRFNLEFPEGQRQANLAAFGRSFAPGGQYLSVR